MTELLSCVFRCDSSISSITLAAWQSSSCLPCSSFRSSSFSTLRSIFCLNSDSSSALFDPPLAPPVAGPFSSRKNSRSFRLKFSFCSAFSFSSYSRSDLPWPGDVLPPRFMFAGGDR